MQAAQVVAMVYDSFLGVCKRLQSERLGCAVARLYSVLPHIREASRVLKAEVWNVAHGKR